MCDTSKTAGNQHNHERVVFQKSLKEGDWSAGQHEDVADDADDADEDDDDVAFWDICDNVVWKCRLLQPKP